MRGFLQVLFGQGNVVSLVWLGVTFRGSFASAVRPSEARVFLSFGCLVFSRFRDARMCGLFSSMVSVCDSGVVMIVFFLFGHHSGTQSNQLSRSECNQCGEWGRYRCLCLVPVSAFVIIVSSLISNAEGFKPMALRGWMVSNFLVNIFQQCNTSAQGSEDREGKDFD